METTNFDTQSGNVTWKGVTLENGLDFQNFMQNDVSARLNDDEGNEDFNIHLRSLASTGFAAESLDYILCAEHPEERDWAVGEAIAESWLAKEYGVVWPWNMERDKRTPKASLPGADLVGFISDNGETQLVVGEVKCSSDDGRPPGVMYGRTGMTHQLDRLATNLTILNQLLKWLLPRCRGTEFESSFNSAVTLLLKSGNKAVCLFGVLLRDVAPDEDDLKSRGECLASTIHSSTHCQLIALYLPCSISDLPTYVSGGS